MTKIDTSTEAVDALLKGVTEGPWGYGKTGEEQRLILGAGGRGNYIANVTIHQIPRHMGLWEEDERESNARFIAASRELVPALLAERNQLRDELDAKLAKAVEALDRIQHGSYGKNAAMARTALKQLTGGKDE